MKSDASQLLDLGERIYSDAAAKCYTATVSGVNRTRDLMRIRSRVEHEGVSFLTLTLPAFGSAFEQCLAKERVDSTDFPGLRKKGCLPTLLWGFTSLVFTQKGELRDDPDIAAIEGIRQIAYAFKKILLACSPARDVAAVKDYLQIEQTLDEFALPTSVADSFSVFSSLLWTTVFHDQIDRESMVPRHGPGATCEGVNGNSKYLHTTWHERLQPYFPFDDTAYYNTVAGTSMLGHVKFIREDDELPVKVTLVPKTLKGPRVIAIEPVCMQYTQQALSRWIISHLEECRLTSGHIHFDDQSINQRLAIIGSQTGRLSTLDLSAASDRVPLSGVERMLASIPDLRDMLLATRSTRAKTPELAGLKPIIVQLRKFASMGSAVCFPIEAMYFFTVIAFALWRSKGSPLTLREIERLTRDVYVYGDDLIVPTDQVEVVLYALAEFGCKVGKNKSFWTGKFRESCGVEAYDGEVVTPTYIRRMCPEDKRDASEILSWVATSNLFYKRGYWLTAAYMRKRVESVVGKLPLVREDSPGIGWISYQGAYSAHRWNNDLHRFEVRTLVPSPVKRKDEIHGPIPALTKCLLSLETGGSGDLLTRLYRRTAFSSTFEKEVAWLKGETKADDAQSFDHLRYTARHGAVKLKSRWVTPY